MKTTIPITPAMRDFNHAVEFADYLLDYQFDQEPADTLLMRLRQAKTFPATANELEKAIVGIAVKQIKTIADADRIIDAINNKTL